MDIPFKIKEMADKFWNKELEKQGIFGEKELERKLEEKILREKRLKEGLKYAKQIFKWASSFRKSKVGRKLIVISHIPIAYKQIFFFDGHVEGADWIVFVVSREGLFLNTGGLYSFFSQKEISSSSVLASSVDVKILKTTCDWINDGRVWECIERRFDYLKNLAD